MKIALSHASGTYKRGWFVLARANGECHWQYNNGTTRAEVLSIQSAGRRNGGKSRASFRPDQKLAHLHAARSRMRTWSRRVWFCRELCNRSRALDYQISIPYTNKILCC